MADLKFTVDTSSLVDAGKKLDDFQKKLSNTAPVLKMVAAVSTVENNLKSLMGAYDKGKISQDVYKKAIQEQRQVLEKLGLTTAQAAKRISDFNRTLRSEQAAAKAARDARDLARAAEEAGLAAQQAATRHEQLKRQFIDGYAQRKDAINQYLQLREALRTGAINIEQYRAALSRLREEQARTGQAAGSLAQGMNRTAVLTQQAGYQIGDFIVQVQSGTNVFVAFGQQATQVAGTLTLLGGKWIAIGTALGITIPLITAAAAAIMRASGESKKLKDVLDEVDAANKKLDDFGKVFGGTLRGDIAAVRKEFGDLVADIYEFDLNLLQKKLSQQFSRGLFAEGFAESFAKTPLQNIGVMDLVFGSGNADMDFRAQQVAFIEGEINKLLSEQITSREELNKKFNQFYSNLVASGSVSEQGMLRLQNIARELGVYLGTISKDENKAAKQREQYDERRLESLREYGLAYEQDARNRSTVIAMQADKEKAKAEEAKKVEKDFSKTRLDSLREYGLAYEQDARRRSEIIAAQADKEKANTEKQQELLKKGQSVLLGYQERLKDLRIEELAATGETSLLLVEQANLAAERARAAVLAKAETEEEKAALQGTADAAAEAARAAVYMADNIAQAKAEAQALESAVAAVGRALGRLQSVGADIQTQIAISRAKIEAMESGANAEIAGRVKAQEERLRESYELGLKAAQDRFALDKNSVALTETQLQLQAELNQGLQDAATLKATLNEEDAKAEALRKAASEAARSGRGAESAAKRIAEEKKKLDEYVLGLRLENQLLQENLYVTEEKLEIERQLLALRQQYGPLFTEQIQRETAALLQQRQVLEEQRDIAQRVGDTIANAFGNAFYDIVTGAATAEEAFKKMALSIVNELFRILVVEKLVKAISGSFGDGGVFGGGNSPFVPNAKGNIFSGGNVVPFATGGVVSSPTLFPMMGGKTGLMGEAGPEAIMPLKRGKDGKLGVEANNTNAAPVVNQKIVNVLDPSVVSEYLSSREGEKVIMNVIRRNRNG